MALADRVPTHVKAARQAVKSNVTVAAPPAAASAAPTMAEFNALRQTVVDLRSALTKVGVVS